MSHEFISQKYCMAQLLYEFNVWTKSLDRRDFVDVLHLDIMKAFDSVSQCRITKNHAYVKGMCIYSKLNWLQEFF